MNLDNLTPEELEMNLGEKIKRLRLNKDWDQKFLAAKADVSVRALRNLENGAGCTVSTLLKVVRALGRLSWLDTVAPIPTINPLTLPVHSEQRVRASGKAQFRAEQQKRKNRVSTTDELPKK